MRLLVTGGTGFLGKNLINVLRSDAKLLIISRKYNKSHYKKINFIKSDFNISESNLKKIKKFNPEILIHLGWENIPNYTIKNSYKNLKDQKLFFKKIFKLKVLKKILVSGSCSEKKNKFNYTSLYFVNAKKNLKKYLKINCEKFNIQLIWLRLFFIFGKYQNNRSLIPYIISSVKKKKKFTLNNPNVINDFIDVQHVCKIIKRLIFSYKKNITMDVGSGYGYKVKDIAKFLENLRLKKKIVIKKYKKNNFVANTLKLKKIIKMKNFYNIENSLKINYKNFT